MTKTTEIALYGTRDAGFDYIATVNGEIVPGGFPGATLRFQSLTDVMFAAKEALYGAGADDDAPVAVYEPGGARCAVTTLGQIGWFGNLRFTHAAPVYVIMADVLMAAAERDDRPVVQA